MDDLVTRFERTWLASAEACRALDVKLAQLVGAHRGLRGSAATPDNVLPMGCEPTALAIRTLSTTPSNAIHCTVLLALIGELLLCAEDGGILRNDTVMRVAGEDAQSWVAPEAMRLLRNAVCHPASAVEGEEATGIASFAWHVSQNFPGEIWATRLNTRPGELASREVAIFSLKLVDDLGRSQAARWSLKLKGIKPRYPHGR